MRSFLAMRRVGNPVLAWCCCARRERGGPHIEQDSDWENKRYRERPLLSDGDGPILAFRRWYRQFDGTRTDVTAAAGSARAAGSDSRETASGTSGDEPAHAAPGYSR